MTKSKTIFLSYSLLLMCLSKVHAQEGIMPAGGNAAGPEGTVSYTIGAICYTTIEDGSTIITQGIQQPYEILIVNGVDEKNITLGSVYPNPTADYVTLSLTGDMQNMAYTLSDMKGKTIREQSLTKPQTNIAMASLANGPYLIKVYNDKKQIKTYKIIKNN
jgi:hypothetical protein